MAEKKGTHHDTGSRGFALMDENKQRDIARKGGEAVSKDREHMSDIGRKGGEAVSKDREHMADIGRKGGEEHDGHKGSSHMRGGSSEQHAKAGRQSHKYD